MRARVPLTFAPAGVTVWVLPGSSVAEAAKTAGVLLAAPCAGRGVCGGCGIKVLSGSLEPAGELELATLKRAPAGVRLACRTRVAGPAHVQPIFSVLQASRAASGTEQEGAASPSRLVAGIDLGTTTVAARLVDAGSGREVAQANVANRQGAFGADVVSRISAALSGEAGTLQRAADDSVAQVLRAAASAGGVQLAQIQRLAIAANTTMAALLSGADVGGLATHPFTAPVGVDRLPAASAVRALLSPSAQVILVPPIAAFVGGDALAATIAAGLVDVAEPTLLVDIGTNAELVLALPDRLLVASTAAGPAFEGVGISSGGPATPGAVERVELSAEGVVLHAIGGVESRWFSGAGLVSAIAALRSAGHIDAGGTMRPEGLLVERFGHDEAGVLEVRLSAEGEAPLTLTQLDVRALQLAKAAVRSGIQTLLRHARISAGDLSEVLVAGAFGAALDPGDLRALGVLPDNVGDRVRRVGNAALDGAAAMALDETLYDLAVQTAALAVHVDLAADPGFNASFVSATEFAPYRV